MAEVKIVGLDGEAASVTVQAQVTAREIIVDRAVDWKRQKSGPADLEYVGSESVTMTFELLFDGVASATPVQAHIANLHRFTDIDPVLKRPPKIQVTYGPTRLSGGVPPFDAVIETSSIRYLVFDANGAALQALVTLRCREANRLMVSRPLP